MISHSDGTINIVIGNGQNIVVGTQQLTLTATSALDDPRRIEIGYVAGGNTIRLKESSLQGGSLGGLLAFRAQDLDAAQNALGRIALGLAQSFNEQHRLGQDLTGALGGDFFTAPAPVVIGNTLNTGSAVVTASVGTVSALTASDYRLDYTGAVYRLTRVADNTTATYATLPQTVDGITFAIASGAAAAGDSFLIQPTRDAARNLAMQLGDPREIAAAAPISTNAAGSNYGTARISAGSVNSPPPPDVNLQQPVTFTFTGAATFDLNGVGTGNPTGVAYTPGAGISYNGWTVSITGSPAAGDTFTVTANSGGSADGRNALLLAGLQMKNTLVGGATTFQGAYSQMVSAVGNKTHQIDITSQAQEKFLAEANRSQQEVSGVNLDEEAANLLRYQQAYQAAGKMIQIAQTLFQTVLELR